MPQPTPFVRGFNFTDYQGSFPSTPLPGYRVDAELDGVADTLSGVLGNLALLQRDDGLLANGVVTVDSISGALLSAIAAAAPPGPRGFTGLSAYDVAIANGFVGTVSAWLTSLKGNPGTPGAPGTNAANPAFTMTATTLAPGAAATVNVTGAYPNLTIAFGIPKGDASTGGTTLATGNYGDITVSAGGSTMVVNKVLGGSTPSVTGHTHAIADNTGLQAALDAKQGLDGTLTALAALTWAAGTQIPVFTAADTISFKTVGQAAGNILDKAAGDALYAPISAGYQPLDATLTAIAAETWTAGKQVYALTAADTVTSLKVGASSATDLIDRAAGDARYQAIGTYATSSQLAAKADLVTTINSYSANQTVSDASHNGNYNKMTGGTTRTITFGSTPSGGHCSIWVNRGTVNMTVICAGGYYKDGAAATATTNIVLAPGDKLTAFHEGSGVWTFEVV